MAFFPSSSARLLRRLPRTWASAGKPLSVCRTRTQKNQKPSAIWAILVADGMLLLFTRFFFLNTLLSLLFFNSYFFDEATQPEVSMTESRTRCVSRGFVMFLAHLPIFLYG